MKSEEIELGLEKAFMLLEPGNLLLLTTFAENKNNLMPISWHMVVDFSPRLAFTTGKWNYSYKALIKKHECTLAVPTAKILKKCIAAGNTSGEYTAPFTDKFAEVGLTPSPARDIQAPHVVECMANIECKIIDHIEKYNIFIVDAVSAWINPKLKKESRIHAVGNGTFILDGKKAVFKKYMLKKPEVGDL